MTGHTCKCWDRGRLSQLIPVLLFLYVLCVSSTSSFVTGQSSGLPGYSTILVPHLSFQLMGNAPPLTVMDYFPSPYGGGAFPLSDRTDDTVDIRIMLPHVLEDDTGCTQPWRSTNEFNQTFDGAFILMQHSQCGAIAFQHAQQAGSRGIIEYGCSPNPPTNCITQLLAPYYPFVNPNFTVIAIKTFDGQSLVSYLNNFRNAGVPPPSDALVGRFVSTGPLIASERAALVDITRQSTMGSFAQGTILQGLPSWSQALVSDPTRDPCRDGRIFGVWCERGNIVSIYALYFLWRAPLGIPAEFGNLTKLRYLNLQANQFSGPIPDSFCQLQDLQALWIGNQFGKKITSLPNCYTWTKLGELRAYSNGISVLPPAFYTTWTNLSYIYLNQNQLNSLGSLANFDKLTIADFTGNNIASPFPGFSKRAPLQMLSLASNQIFGTVPANAFDGFNQMELLDMSANLLTGGLPSLADCGKLNYLDLSLQASLNGTGGFNGTVPSSWSNLLSLTTLNLSRNKLQSPIMLSVLLALSHIDLSNNSFTCATEANLNNTNFGNWLDTVTGPNFVSLKASFNLFAGTWSVSNILSITSGRALYVSHNQLTSIFPELFISPLITVDASYNQISSGLPLTSPLPGYILLNLEGNPINVLTLPPWVEIDPTRIQRPGDPFLCSKFKSNTAPLMSFEVSPGFYNYAHCTCQGGSFGAPPLCANFPSFAEFNPYHLVSSDEIGPSFPDLVQRTAGIANQLLAHPSTSPVDNSTAVNSTVAVPVDSSAPVYFQGFSDSMYGFDNRLMQGLITSFVIDLQNLYADDPTAYNLAGIPFPVDTPVHVLNDSVSLPSALWTPVRMITIRFHLNLDVFTRFEDVITVYEGGSDLKGNRVFSVRGSEQQTFTVYSDYYESDEYYQLYNNSLSQFTNSTLTEVRVFSPIATVQFSSRVPSGSHFFATYSYDFVCPTGYFYDTVTTPASPACRPMRVIVTIGNGVRAAVLFVSIGACLFALFNLVIFLRFRNSVVYKAGSRPFELLLLSLLGLMALGALLYAGVPDPNVKGLSLCLGRFWVTTVPLSGILAVFLAKSWRLHSIFSSTSLKAKNLSQADTLKLVSLVMGIQIVFLIIFSAVGLSKPSVALGQGGYSDKVIRLCSQERYFFTFVYLEIAFILALMLPAAYLGFKCRDLPSQFNVSQHVQNALVLIMCFMVIVIPLAIYTQDSPDAGVLIQGISQALLATMLTATIFGPKLYYLHQTLKSEKEFEKRNQAKIMARAYDAEHLTIAESESPGLAAVAAAFGPESRFQESEAPVVPQTSIMQPQPPFNSVARSQAHVSIPFDHPIMPIDPMHGGGAVSEHRKLHSRMPIVFEADAVEGSPTPLLGHSDRDCQMSPQAGANAPNPYDISVPQVESVPQDKHSHDPASVMTTNSHTRGSATTPTPALVASSHSNEGSVHVSNSNTNISVGSNAAASPAPPPAADAAITVEMIFGKNRAVRFHH